MSFSDEGSYSNEWSPFGTPVYPASDSLSSPRFLQKRVRLFRNFLLIDRSCFSSSPVNRTHR